MSTFGSGTYRAHFWSLAAFAGLLSIPSAHADSPSFPTSTVSEQVTAVQSAPAGSDPSNPFSAPICRKRAASNQVTDASGLAVPDAGASAIGTGKGERTILFYRNPMGLADTSTVPKKDHMGMDYVPVYADPMRAAASVTLLPEKIQRTGIETVLAVKKNMSRTIRAPGTVHLDEQRVTVVAPRFDAFVESVGNVTTGSRIAKGESLMTLYGQEIINQGTWLLVDVNAGSGRTRAPDVLGNTPRSQTLIPASRRLRELGAPEEFIEEITRKHKVPANITVKAPGDGIILERTVSAGQALKAGDVAFRIGDISTVWLDAEIPEGEIGAVQPGLDVTIEARAYPGSAFRGAVALVYPQINPETRTARVRISLANLDSRLLPGMFAEVQLMTRAPEAAVALPMNAVIDSGTRQVAILETADGKYEVRDVELGVRGDGFVEILRGIAEGDRAVVNGNFLIDSESNLQSALSAFSANSNTEAQR